MNDNRGELLAFGALTAVVACVLSYTAIVVEPERKCEKLNNVYDCEMLFQPTEINQ